MTEAPNVQPIIERAETNGGDSSPPAILLILRLNPEDAVAAGYDVEFMPDEPVCDFCDGPPDHRVNLRPQPGVLRRGRIVYLGAEWRLCNACHDAHERGKAEQNPRLLIELIQRTAAGLRERGVEKTAAAGHAHHMVSAFQQAHEPYRSRSDALAKLAELNATAEEAVR